MIRYIYLLGIVFALFSCTSERQSAENAFVISYDEDAEFDWDAILQVEEVIPLETNDSCMLSYANNCVFGENRIVYNDSKQRALFVFDGKGKFLYQIDALGVGDKEYSIIKDVIVSRDKRNILLLDNTSILVFDLETGVYRNRIALDKKLASSFYRFADGGNSRFYFWSVNPDNCLYVSDGGHLFAMKERRGFPFVCQKFYQDAAGKLNLISDCGQYSIETLSGDSVLPKYSFDFGRWAFPADEKAETVTEWEKIDEQPYFKSLLSAFETEDVLYVSTATPKKQLYCIAVQKSTSQVFCGNQSMDTPVVVISSDGTSFYGILYPSLFMEDSRMARLIKGYDVTEEDNPLLVKFKFDFGHFDTDIR